MTIRIWFCLMLICLRWMAIKSAGRFEMIAPPPCFPWCFSLDPGWRNESKASSPGPTIFSSNPSTSLSFSQNSFSFENSRAPHNVVQMQAAQLAIWNKELQANLEQESRLAEVVRSLGDIGHDIKNM